MLSMEYLLESYYYYYYKFCTVLVSALIILILWLATRKKTKNVCVVVLGDVGRSPRMQNHALSFAKEGYEVDVVGYAGSDPLTELREHPEVKIWYMRPVPNLPEGLPRLLSYGIKVIWQCVTLLATFFTKRRSSYLILQNPPGIPTIPICWLFCTLTGVQFTIDWHNYAYTIQALNSGSDDIFVKVTRRVEFSFGRQAKSNLCVSEAMRADLQNRWNIRAKVLYDRPSEEFHSITLAEKHLFLLKLSKVYEQLCGQDQKSTAFTETLENGEIALRKERPALIVSSTSWTPDEDFEILISALQEYETNCLNQVHGLPDIICFITGKGPLKEFYRAIMDRKNWRHITVITPWLENTDYPKLLASADLGICLHVSSSGIDLPMKLVDMFGSGLPAFAYNYKGLNELLVHDRNGMVFSDSKDLAQLLIKWFQNFPDNEEQQFKDKKFREQLKLYQEEHWHNVERTDYLNDRPIIGILTQEISYSLNLKYPNQYESYIAASYVKFVEGAGALAVPIWIGKDESYYEDILSKVNGVLWPGGSSYFNVSDGYAEAGAIIYTIATRLNNQGDYFPIWGTCLGFELMTYVAAGGIEHRTDCSSNKQALPLEFVSDFKSSRMFENASEKVIDILSTYDVTANFHQYCVTRDDLKKVNLTSVFRVMSVNHDWNGLEFISTIEHVELPFYGIQFHPEKNLYEWVANKNIPHNPEASLASQYFANFFVNEARKNSHSFPNGADLDELIYNYQITFTGRKNSSFMQTYMFTNLTTTD
ncbi:chitobiosyldiphosphodolichol beta-mannosyltransferase-like [Neodiprion virginianus]|uniref:chitobiosyldiphosphodolichol beta-mannosyltransferase-like n=1 Tax=Neodiprion virginianus TaxID=2961670 RepID=UPI001EE6E15D|nr:chitobiosyldiphosphodolichol beta-mannosyltransferase-like [Neodiprion virginianus]